MSVFSPSCKGYEIRDMSVLFTTVALVPNLEAGVE